MTDTNEHSSLQCVIAKIIYQNQENNYIVALSTNGVRLCGKFFDAEASLLIDEEVTLEGKWENHKKYGSQFSFDSLQIKENELVFFLTKIIKGLSKAIVKSMMRKYTEEELCAILDNEPTKLLQFKGIKEKKLESIVANWKQFKHLRELGSFLSKFSVSTKMITKIYEEFASVANVAQKIEENPYMLTKVKGIGFKRADEIAKQLRIDPKSPLRIKACIKYTLTQYCENNGNSSISKDLLLSITSKALGFGGDDAVWFEAVLLELLGENDIVSLGQNRYAPKNLYFYESFILQFLRQKAKQYNPKKMVGNLEEFLHLKANSFGFSLSDEQRYGVELINNGAMIIALIGYAGTGKTTSSKAILELLSQKFLDSDIVCMALSGIAAQRISDATGFGGATIQSILLANESKEKFDYKVILIDEASMINSVIFYQLFCKIDDDCIVIIVGDDGQLPPIGAGDVFANIIKHQLIPISKLTKIYRQNEQQAIAIIANDIRLAKVPNYTCENYNDFTFVGVGMANYYQQKNALTSSELSNARQNISHEILDATLGVASQFLRQSIELINAKQIAKFLTLFQVITPMKGGVLGVENLNFHLKKLFNQAPKITYRHESFELSIADKVIHIKNENMRVQTLEAYRNKSDEFYEKRVFNGMLGIVIKIDLDEHLAVVLYPNDELIVFYDLGDAPMLLSLAYALTIHKTQGMEYENVAIVMSFSHYIMHNTKLLYTAITRAKKMCFVIGEKEAFENGCKKIDTTIRESVMNDLLSIGLPDSLGMSL